MDGTLGLTGAALALIAWTLIMQVWMFAVRLPAMRKAGIAPREGAHVSALDALPSPVRRVADNYNHLLEQPTLFYAAAILALVTAPSGGAAIAAWAYVALRIAHSLVQSTFNDVTLRFVLFNAASLALAALVAQTAIALV